MPYRLRFRRNAILRPTAPFHFVATVHKPSHFPAQVSVFERETLWFVLRVGRRLYGVRLRPRRRQGDVVAALFARGPISAEVAGRIALEIQFRFGMQLDIAPFLAMAARDSLLAPLAVRWAGMRPSCAFSLYEQLCISLVLQNTQVSRSVTMLSALLQEFGTSIEFDGRHMYAFWQPSALAGAMESRLRSLRVGYRAKAFRRTSQFFTRHPNFDSEVRDLPKDEARQRLMKIFGVGPATSWYLLFENLKHLDALEHVSPWEQQILSRLMFHRPLVPVDQLLARAEKRWGRFKMLAAHYLFEDLFWQRKRSHVEWLERLIRL